MPRKKATKKSSPTRKTEDKRKSTSVPSHALSKAYESEISYETKVIITVLLLLFVYPVGLIVMWFWMRQWPLWLKILLSLPVIAFILVFIATVLFVGAVIHSARSGNNYYRYHRWQPTPTVSVTATPTPSPITY